MPSPGNLGGHEVTQDQVAPNEWVLEQPFFMLLNVAVGGNLGGVNQAFSDALCGLTGDTCETETTQLQLGFAVDANRESMKVAASDAMLQPADNAGDGSETVELPATGNLPPPPLNQVGVLDLSGDVFCSGEILHYNLFNLCFIIQCSIIFYFF